MKISKPIFFGLILAASGVISIQGAAFEGADESSAEGPAFDSEGKLLVPNPENYAFLSSSFRLRSEIQPDNDNIPPEQSGEFIIIRTHPNSIAYFKEKGVFPEGTILTMDFFWANKIDSEQKYFGHGFKGTRVSVKDSNRFSKGWGFFQFRAGQEAAELLPEEDCLACHEARASETDLAFTEFYSIFNK